jgi:hypothetical protein
MSPLTCCEEDKWRDGVTDSAITEFGIKRQKCKSGISYNAFSANPESPIMETAIKESPIMIHLSNPDSAINGIS